MITKEEKQEAIGQLLAILKPGDIVYTVLRHLSRSAMNRSISAVIHDCDEIVDITWLVSKALGWPIDRQHGGIKIDGCGMDVGFHLVYSLGQALWPDGTESPHSLRNGEPDICGGYALKHRWI